MKSLLLLPILVAAVLAGTTDPEPRPDQWWVDRHNSYKQNTIDNGANVRVLFYGDSITEGWGGAGKPVFDEHYAPLGTANYGIGGDQTQHLLYRIENGEVEGLAPKLCVLKIGTNNIGYPDEDIIRGVLAVKDLLRTKLPEMRVLLLGILPRNNAEVTARIEYINTQVYARLGSETEYWVKFVDLRNVFYPNNQFNTDLYTDDLLHLSAAGYAAWQRAMDPVFQDMLEN